MSNVVSPRAFINSVLHNGVGRYVCQLQRVTFKFCKTHGGSRGMREFIEKDLVDFAKGNPGVVVYLKPRRHGTACIWVEYLNGNTDYIGCPNYSRTEIVKWVEYVRNRSGLPIARFLKYSHTDSPSVQGVWTPFTHKPSFLNIASFPTNLRSEMKPFFPSATDQLLEMAKQFDTVEIKSNSDTSEMNKE